MGCAQASLSLSGRGGLGAEICALRKLRGQERGQGLVIREEKQASVGEHWSDTKWYLKAQVAPRAATWNASRFRNQGVKRNMHAET